MVDEDVMDEEVMPQRKVRKAENPPVSGSK